jgi:hypothetical protein
LTRRPPPTPWPDSGSIGRARPWSSRDNQTRVVVYDTNYVSVRVWWMFRVFGHDSVVLDVSLTKCLAEGGPVESGEVLTVPLTSLFRVTLLALSQLQGHHHFSELD